MNQFFSTNIGKTVAGFLIAFALLLVIYSLKSNFGSTAAAESSNRRICVDAATGQSFTVDVKPGMTFPVKAPSGGNTGYEYDEICGWTADGHVADHPTYVLLNSTVGKTGPTFCPDCHRLVVKDNPPAEEGAKPPPTEAEYAAHHGR